MNEARERILDAALRLIGERGVGGLSNRAVAASAGVSLGTLTYHFGSQTDLLRECLDRFVDTELDRITRTALALAGDVRSPEQAADEAERAIVAFTNEPEQIANLELHLQAARDPALRPAAERSLAAYDRLATSILTALGVPEPERHAPTVVTLLYGLAVRRLATGDAAATGTAEALRTVLTGVLAEAARSS
ncbi:TetR/AcrR family transcriptional regulator [Actinocorallia libanotica]|uniref:TetR/AcrR family transcriptional regulator n=2 Tax=Actinocorallia libanotica TaxID=46162 RepID=A0ABP4BYK7_9ACTN